MFKLAQSKVARENLVESNVAKNFFNVSNSKLAHGEIKRNVESGISR